MHNALPVSDFILNDDAFKVIIFTPGNEELMARMLEVLLPGKTIRSLEFRPTEQHGLAISDKISNFDAPSLLPQVVVADSFNRVFFRSSGYTIGRGARLADVAARL